MQNHRPIPASICLLLLVCTGAPGQPPRALQPDTVAALRAAVEADDPVALSDPVWAACVGRHGTIAPAIAWLRQHADQGPEGQRDDALRLLAHLFRRHGDLDDAFGALDRIPEQLRTVGDDLARAEVLDALGRTNDALQAYEALLGRDIPTDLSRRLMLRTALMRPVVRGAAKSPLAAAAEKWDTSLKNQAAIVLALQNRHQEALDLFVVQGEGSKRFKQEVRLAEWAIEAKEWRQAQDWAWAAVRSAKMKRDRRYALAVLVEAHRRANALEGLLQHFARTEKLDDETRLVWIDLLREMGKVDEALRLFREASAGAEGSGFTNDMRRQLLELCRETGREETLVAAYEKLIEEQPRTVEWREGLSRYHLEQGNRAAALECWKTHLDVVTETRGRMTAAASLMKLGLDDLSNDVARSCIGRSAAATNAAYLFLFELYSDRGREADALKALRDLEGTAEPDAPVRLQIADAYARIGDKANAARILQELKDARGPRSGTDSDVKLAVLYSEIGQEEKAQDLWFELWGRVSSVPRRKFVEERLMTVAARLGTLARIAVDLESKLAEGKASAREAGMLVSLYTRVNDAVSATEIVEEHLKQTGAKSIDILVEKARLYLSCHDYHNYAEVLRKLIEIDPEGRPDHLRELAMNLLERGQRREAREVLTALNEEPSDTTSVEFEAGVLSLAGLHELALEAYYRSLAASPDRIDGYLLLSNTLITLGHRARAAGMFQYLAADANKDDLFTIAVDGILNLYGPRRQPGPDPLLAWTRRAALERVAARPDKPYLYQLVADLSDEYGDRGMARRALQAALPIAGEQRSALLRELMERTASNANDRVNLGGIARGNRRGSRPSPEHLMFGRRLLGQGELVPPDVYLQLGTAFLQGKEVVNASRTFNAASRLPEFDELQPKIAGAFEAAGYAKEALRVYERILTVESRSVSLIAKVGELHERMGRDDLAQGLFERGIDLYLAGKSFIQTLESETRELSPMEQLYLRSSNLDEIDQIYPRLLNGLIATVADAAAARKIVDRLSADMDADLARVAQENVEDPRIGRFPRIAARAKVLRRIAGAFGLIGALDRIDGSLLNTFPSDPALLDETIRFRIAWGYRASAKRMLAKSALPAATKSRHELRLGLGGHEGTSGLLKVGQLSPLALPLLANDQRAELIRLLERLDLSDGKENDLEHLPTLVNASLVIGDADLCLSLLRFWVDTSFGHIRDSAKLNIQFTNLMTQAQEIRILTASQRQSLMGRIVDRIANDPDRFSTLVRRLYTLIDLTEGSIDADQVEALIRAGLSAVDQLSYGIPELFALLPADRRDQVLRGVWNLVARTQRSYFIANYVRQYDIKTAAMRKFLLDNYVKGLREADSILSVASVTRRLPQELRPANLDLIMSMLDAIEKRDKTIKFSFSSVARRLETQARTGREEDAWKATRALWPRYANEPEGDRRSLERLVRLFGATRRAEMAELVASVTDESKRKALERTLERTVPRKPAGPPRPGAAEAHLEAMRARVAASPDDDGALLALRNALLAGSYWIEAIDVETRLYAKSGSPGHMRSLFSRWRMFRNDIKALEVNPKAARKPSSRSDRGAPERAAPANLNRLMGSRIVSSSVIGRPTGVGLPQVTEQQVKAALKKKDPSAARALYRATWRQNQDQRIYRSFRSSSVRTNANRHVANQGPSRGGFPSSLDMRSTIFDWKPRPWKPAAPDRTKLPYLMTKAPFGLDELSRHLRSTDPANLATPEMEDVLRALGDASIAKDGVKATAPILERHRQGQASAQDYARLFVLLQALEERPKDITVDTLDAILANVGDDVVLLRRLAGLYARFGFAARAGALYSWCAANPGPVDQFGRPMGSTDPSDLLSEVLARLEGRHRTQAVATILRATRFRTHDRHGLDRFESQTLGMLIALDGATVAYEQARSMIESLFDPGQPPRRETSMISAGLLARRGDPERALRLVEISLLPSSPPPSALPHEIHYWNTQRSLHDDDLRWLFPKDTSDFKDAGAWFEAAAARVRSLRKDDRLPKDLAFRLLCVLAIRLEAAGRHETAVRLIPDVEKLSRDHPEDALWVADVLRATGHEADAYAIERALFDEGRLHPERFPTVVGWVLENEGAAAARKIGEPLTTHSLHPELLGLLVRAARQDGDEAAAARWTELAERAAEATKKIDGESKK